MLLRDCSRVRLSEYTTTAMCWQMRIRNRFKFNYPPVDTKREQLHTSATCSRPAPRTIDGPLRKRRYDWRFSLHIFNLLLLSSRHTKLRVLIVVIAQWTFIRSFFRHTRLNRQGVIPRTTIGILLKDVLLEYLALQCDAPQHVVRNE